MKPMNKASENRQYERHQERRLLRWCERPVKHISLLVNEFDSRWVRSVITIFASTPSNALSLKHIAVDPLTAFSLVFLSVAPGRKGRNEERIRAGKAAPDQSRR